MIEVVGVGDVVSFLLGGQVISPIVTLEERLRDEKPNKYIYYSRLQ